MLVVLPTLLQTQVLLLACCCSPSVELRCSRCSVAVVVVRGSSLQYVNWGVVSPGDVVGFGVALPESTGFHRPTLQGESTPSPTITWLKTLDPFWAWVDHQAPPLGFPWFLANSQVHENSTVVGLSDHLALCCTWMSNLQLESPTSHEHLILPFIMFSAQWKYLLHFWVSYRAPNAVSLYCAKKHRLSITL